MKYEKDYKAQYSLKEILDALGLTNFKDKAKGQPVLSKNTMTQKRRYGTMEQSGAIQKSLAYSPDIAFKTLASAISDDLYNFVISLDGKALIRRSLTYVNVYLTQADNIAHNTLKIFKFLKAREQRYTALIKHSETINKAVNQDNLDKKNGEKKKLLYLRLGSIEQIKNMNAIQYNRLLDDIVLNLEHNETYTTVNQNSLQIGVKKNR